MNGALMFVAYPNTNGKDIVLSPRVSTAHVEPSYNENIKLSQVDPPSGDPHPNGIHDETWFVSAHCQNCTNVGYGVSALDLTSKNQPFIFAFGNPSQDPNSNSLDAPLRRHGAYGFFTMDMTLATVTSGDISKVTVPALGTKANGADIEGQIKNDRDVASPSHALFMVFAFLVMFPLGVFSQRVLGKIKLHSAIQAGGLLIVIIGMGLGLWAGKYYNRVRPLPNLFPCSLR